MVIHKPTHYAYKDVKGAFYQGRWGVEIRIPVSDAGTWEVPKKHVFTARKPRR